MGKDVAAESAGAQPRVPGTVQLMTSEPIVLPASAAAGQDSLREQLEERPWLLAIGALALVGLFLVIRTRRTD